MQATARIDDEDRARPLQPLRDTHATVAEVAQAIDRSNTWVRRLAHDGKLGPFIRIGPEIWFDRANLRKRLQLP